MRGSRKSLPQGNEKLMDWVRGEGLDPDNLWAVADFNGDGTITMFRFLADEEGGRYFDIATGDPACEPITFTPTCPMPYVGAVGV